MTINIWKRNSELVVSFDYSQERIYKVKGINGYKWNPIDKILLALKNEKHKTI